MASRCVEEVSHQTDWRHQDGVYGGKKASRSQAVHDQADDGTELRLRGVDLSEIAGLLGYVQPGYEGIELYAECSPQYMSWAMRAIDDYFGELEPLLKEPLIAKSSRRAVRPDI